MVFGFGGNKDKPSKKEKQRSGSTKQPAQRSNSARQLEETTSNKRKPAPRSNSARHLEDTSSNNGKPRHAVGAKSGSTGGVSPGPALKTSNNNNGVRQSTVDSGAKIRPTSSSNITSSTNAPRHASPLKSAMKSNSKYNNAAVFQLSPSVRASLATPISPRASHKYIGPIDVDDIPSVASLSVDVAKKPTPLCVDVDDLPSYRPAPTSTIKSAAKKTEAVIYKPPIDHATPPAYVTPPKSPTPYKAKSNSKSTRSVPTAILERSPSNNSISKSILTFGSGLPFPNSAPGPSGSYSKDDLSIISLDKSIDTMSIMSRVSVHMDHFLAEMALADNAKLEQLAVEEMKHRQIIPQKIKKLNKKIAVLHEERDVLVGLIDQLQELVDNQEEAKKQRRQKRKEKKQIKKEQKKQAKREAEAKRRQQELDDMAKKAETERTQEIDAMLGEDTDSDDEYLAQRNMANNNQEDSVRGNWWADDVSKVEERAAPSAVAAIGSSDPILGISSSGVAREDDDEFAKLWNDSFSGSEGNDYDDKHFLDIPTLDAPDVASSAADASSYTGAKVAAGVGAAAIGVAAAAATIASVRDKTKKEDGEDNGKEMANSEVKPEEHVKKAKVEIFALVETLPDRPEDDELIQADENNKVDEELESDDERNLSLPANLGLTCVTGAPLLSPATKRSPPISLRSMRLAKAGKTGMSMDDESTASNHSGMPSSRRANRFSAFHETDTYLPDHMPRSAGNTPEGSEREAEDESDSDPESDSDSESQSSGSSIHTNPILEEEEEEAQPSTSHHLAKQLMARLKQQEKQQEQEELQRNLQGIIRRNSLRRLSEEGLEADPKELDESYADIPCAGNQPASIPLALGNTIHSTGIQLVDSDLASSSAAPAVYTAGKSHDDSDEVTVLRKELEATIDELEKLREERKLQELRVQQLLSALETKFEGGDEDDAEEEELEEADDINESFDAEDAPKEDTTAEPKKRKRMQVILTQKIDECAELTATVELLREQVSQKQANIEDLQAHQLDDTTVNDSRSISADAVYKKDPVATTPLSRVASTSADLSMDVLQKQLLEKTAECLDLQDQIQALTEQLQEKDQQYQEVHRDLFTVNLALGVEVDRKATAQQALDEKCQELEAVQKENDGMNTKMAKFEERIEALDDELLSRATMLDEMKQKHDEGLSLVSSDLERAKAELGKKSKELEGLRLKVVDLEREKDEIVDMGAANDTMVVEMRNLLVEESDKREQLELQIIEAEREKMELRHGMEQLKKENEFNKALLQDKNESGTTGGKSIANVQSEVEKLIAENAELKKTLAGVQESETNMKKERERLVANATNMSIMLADSRAKVDFLQMQVEEYKNGPLSNSEHGLKSQSEHGFGTQAMAFRKLIAGSAGATAGGAPMGDNSERSVGSMGGSQKGARSARFRSFLQNRMGPGAANTATSG